ncbi:C40 family peptidase [Alkalihalobacillus sp. MEB203]|uniref:C40 family peptidase n=1 Tax=Alkalihalobacterium chitinilyticum TaxID=2980103 RepID=A0ABT5VDK8_9BACI|nr:NlpC/P60 family protein [Alkalihalobacterium chitinilyticum]MDE5413546.1 C40 family peptidase [Alkalihalobacterium chitinilyticum]
MIFSRTFRQQASLGTSVQNLERGDLISFTNQDLYTDGRVGHVGIYMGNGDMTHASSSEVFILLKTLWKLDIGKQNYLLK